jgi:hypothetical protein
MLNMPTDDLTARVLKHLDTEAMPVWRTVRGIASRLSADEKDVLLCLIPLEEEGIVKVMPRVDGMETFVTPNTPLAPDAPQRKKSSRRRR